MQKTASIIAILFLFCNPAYSYDLGFLEIHGFASPGYMISSGNSYLVQEGDGSFQFNEFGINFATTLKDDIFIGAQLLSRDLGTVGNNKVNLNWGLIDYQWRNEISLKLGKIKLPHGLYNDTRDYDMLRTSILLPQSIYDEYFRGTMESYTGMSTYGNLALGKGGRLGYEFYLGTDEIESDGGIDKYLSTKEFRFKSGDIDHILGGRLKWYTPLNGLMLCTSYYQIDITLKAESQIMTIPINMKMDMSETRSTVFSGEYSIGNLTMAAEYEMVKSDYTITLDMSRLGQPDPPPTEMKMDSEHYYGLLSYRFTDWFEAGSYYSVFYDDKNDRDGKKWVTEGLPDFAAWQKDFTLSTRFDINDFWLIKLEIHFMDGVAMCPETDNLNGFDKNWTLFALKTTFNF